MSDVISHSLRRAIRTIPDHPRPGILFRDITTLLGDAGLFRLSVEQLARPFLDAGIDKVAAIEARGFIFGGAVANRLGIGLVPVRKRGKLPWQTVSESYDLEYGTDELEVHVDAVHAGERILIIDDLIATGGTVAAAVRLMRRLEAEVVAAAFVIDLPDLGGAQAIRQLGPKVHVLVSFEGH